ncbi:response regulator transcription factor [Corynebacterium sp. CCM 8835]|uniref:Response regulator transcription factor n=1 Tax=Corynebacterium antarcticum TaxID=2800405 RepID=A0ABS1FLC6_9CORY|nr:response regulator transcription factor [Corynebacterium antarcticum]MCK7642622.1 response regulator transcription factor [Corynebacterium antarcticum]MCK7660690.1 response regulator transcription factor [Corynebacterium antarcticum]MCL0245436.1 response regulator transcription factor [Corynebacterium antarcticum]MCX7540006.1 response regulator transcription factor [Corynebacterium antarcticum]
MIRVLLADDQPLVVQALEMTLSTQPDIEVVATAADGAEALEAVAAHRIDVAVLDIQMPRVDGIGVAREILARHPGVRVLMLTTFDAHELVRDALTKGVHGFLLKDCGPEALIDAVRRVDAGASVLSPGVTDYVLRVFRGHTPTPPAEPLTDRERDVLAGIARARTNAEISADLHIGEATVKTYISRLLAKTGTRDRVGLALWARDHELHL